MSDKTENVRIQLYINNEKAQAALREMDKEYNKLRASQKKFATGSEDWRKLQKEIDGVTAKQIAFRKTMDLSSMSLRQLEGHSRQLKASFAHMIPNTPEFTAMRDRIGEVDQRIKNVRSGLGPFAQAWKNVSGEVKGVITAFAMMAGSQVLSWFKGLITGAGDLSDQLANIQRLSGMTAEEVGVLNKELGSINTRTATKDLREMAATAGQFGVAKEDIAGFVEQVDKINVVMGPEFGGNAQLVAETLAKLRNVLTDIKSSKIDKDLSHIGNALTVLAQQGVATAPVIADFANRIGGYGIQAGLSSAQVLGLSATLQELSVSTERGGTAITKIIMKMFSNVDQFAKIAGLSVEDFQKMLNTDLFGAFTLVMKKSKELGTDSVELNKIIQDLEVAGAGASEVFAKLGANTELLELKVNNVGDALKKTTTITNQAETANSTLGATLDILRKDFAKLFTNNTVQEGLKTLVLAFVKVVAVLRALPTFLKDNKNAIWLLAAAIATFNGQLIASRAAALADIAVKKIQEIWILRAEIAQAALNRTMKANPILAITGLILGAVAAYKIFTNHAGAARKAQEELNEKIREGQDLLSSTGKIEDRFNVINKLSKESVTQLKNDIAGEIQAYKDKDAEIIAWAWKSGVNTKLLELNKKFNAEKSELGRAYLASEIAQERELIDAKIKAQFGYSMTEAALSKKRLGLMETEVAAKLSTFKTEKVIAETESEDVVKILDKTGEKVKEIGEKIRKSLAGGGAEIIGDKIAFIDKVNLLLMGSNERELELSRRKWMEYIRQAEKYGLDTTGLYAAMYSELQLLQDEANRKAIDENKKTNDQIKADDQNLADTKLQLWGDVGSAIGTTLDMVASMQGRYTEFQKALAFTQILIEEAKAIASAISGATAAASAGGPAAPYLIAGYIISMVASVMNGIMQAKNVMGQADVPAYAKGEEYINGPGTTTSDSINARLSKGERVVPADINSQLNGIPNRLLPKMLNFNFAQAMAGINRNQSAAPSGMNYNDGNVQKLLLKVVSRLESVEKTIKNKKDWVETDISISGRKGLVKKMSDYEETKSLANI